MQFDKKAMQKFNQIPDDMTTKLLSNVYCSNCKNAVKIVDFIAKVINGDLILNGKCEKCSSEVVRLIEG